MGGCSGDSAEWRQIAEQFQDYPPALSFELLNEPHGKLTADKWNDLIPEAIAVIRRTNPTRRIVVGPAGWNSVKHLKTLRLPEDDRNLVVTFHYYLPLQFTHQGAGWVGRQSQKWLGTKWTGTPAEKSALGRDLDAAIRWAVEHRRPVFMGEFGAYSRADMASRVRWTSCVADEAIRRRKRHFAMCRWWDGTAASCAGSETAGRGADRRAQAAAPLADNFPPMGDLATKGP